MLNFGKLFKYEWKNTSKVPLLILLYLGIATAIGCSAFILPVWDEIARYPAYTPGQSLLGVLSMFSSLGFILLYTLSLSAAPTVLMVYFAVNFYQSMYTRRGYLTHTLPVSSHTLLCSKILTFGIWSFLNIIAMLVSVMIFIMVCLTTLVGAAGLSLKNLWDLLGSAFLAAHDLFALTTGSSLVVYIIVIILAGLIQSFTSIILVLTAITIGQLSAKHKVLMSILSYLGVMFINFFVGLITSVITTSYALPVPGATVNLYAPQFIGVAISVAFAVGGYILSSYIIRNKLNLQ